MGSRSSGEAVVRREGAPQTAGGCKSAEIDDRRPRQCGFLRRCNTVTFSSLSSGEHDTISGDFILCNIDKTSDRRPARQSNEQDRAPETLLRPSRRCDGAKAAAGELTQCDDDAGNQSSGKLECEASTAGGRQLIAVGLTVTGELLVTFFAFSICWTGACRYVHK